MPNPTAWAVLAEQRKCLIQRMLGAEFSEPSLEAFQFQIDPLREFCASCFIQRVMLRRVPGSDLMGPERKHFSMFSRRRRLRHGLILSSHEGLVSRAWFTLATGFSACGEPFGLSAGRLPKPAKAVRLCRNKGPLLCCNACATLPAILVILA